MWLLRPLPDPPLHLADSSQPLGQVSSLACGAVCPWGAGMLSAESRLSDSSRWKCSWHDLDSLSSTLWGLQAAELGGSVNLVVGFPWVQWPAPRKPGQAQTKDTQDSVRPPGAFAVRTGCR